METMVKIDEARIYKLAWNAQLDLWATEHKRYEETGSELSKRRAELRWNELMKIEEMIRAKGYNQCED